MIKAIFIVTFVLATAVVVQAVPPTPTNTPVAHPLAPNPHTSVGLFWIYTDANTGRQWTGGTYKVLRCSSASCTPVTEVVTGLTHADWQDTGRTANTVYGYCVKANDGADSGCSPTVYVTTLAADSNFVQFPNSKWSDLLGPLPEAAQIPYAYYRDTATTAGQYIISRFPIVGPAGTLQGTGAISNGSTTLTGTGTNFLEQVAANNPSCLDVIVINGVNAGAIASVDSNTQITLVTSWTGSTVSGVALSTNTSVTCDTNTYGDPFNDYLTGNQLGYYDSPKGLIETYFETGDPQYLRGALQYVEAIFAGYLWLGRNRAWNGFSTTENLDNMPAPRNYQFQSMVLLGLAGHNGVWDSLDKYIEGRYFFLSSYRGGDNNFMFLREKAYVIAFTTWFVIAAPDSFPRSNGTTTSLNGGTTVDGTLATGRKGHWRDELNTDIPGFVLDDQNASGDWFEYNAGGSYADNDEPYPPGVQIPWHVGLLTDALGYCWRNTALSSTARNAARKMVLRAAASMATRAYDTNIAPDETSFRRRTGWYGRGGGNRLNPYSFEHGSDSAILNNVPDANMIAQYRQLLPLMQATFGWAWEMSGQTIYLTWGDEIANAWNAAVGENTGGTGDGKKSLCDNTANRKDVGQCFARGSGHYFGQRLNTYSSLGTPPSVTMPSNVTLTGGVNQVSLTASVSCTNTPCTGQWYLVEYHEMEGREAIWPTFSAETSTTTVVSGFEPGVYKLGYYAIDSLGLTNTPATVNVTVGDGVFPPVVMIHKAGAYEGCTQTSSISSINVRAWSAAGRTLNHSLSAFKPKDASAPTVTPDTTTGNNVNITISGLASAPSWYVLKDTVTDSAGAVTSAYFSFDVQSTCGSAVAPPSSGHNTIPTIAKHPNHILPTGSTATILYVAPQDPEGVSRFTAATGYTAGYNGDLLVTALSDAWSQTAGPVSATITTSGTISGMNCSARKPCVTGLTTGGTYTFQYAGTDPQGDTATALIDVTVSGNQESNPRVKLIAISMCLFVAMMLGISQMALRQLSLRRSLKPGKPVDKYRSVVGPDRYKRLRAKPISMSERFTKEFYKVRKKE